MYKEFEHLKIVKDEMNPFSTLYEYEDGSRFYIEPLFYSYLTNFKEHFEEKYQTVLKEMEETVKRNKRVIFTGMDEEFETDPVTNAEGYIILTLFDITDKLCIFWDNKSRGSDYGD